MDESRREALRRLEVNLGYRFSDPSLLERALTHRSYVNEKREPGLSDNERLEFLGDAVLQLAVSDLLFNRFPGFSEGVLTQARASLVTEHSLSRLARVFGIGDCLLLGRGEESSGGRDKDSLLANAFEAVLAAVFMDVGYRGARKTVADLFERLTENLDTEVLQRDYKSRLQELSHELYHTTPYYRVAGTRGPDHNKTFDVEVIVTEVLTASGSGRNKKEAEQQAAHRALDIMARMAESEPSS